MTVSERLFPLGDHMIPYVSGSDCADDLADAVTSALPQAQSILAVVDQRVIAHADQVLDRLGQSMRIERFVLDVSERDKRLSLVERIMTYGVERGIDRRSCVAGFGGGFVGNVAGLVAALLYRGLPLIQLPTTPVAAFDAVLSMKQGVNLTSGKNLSGTYLAPTLIGCDLRWLATVPQRELSAGIAEMAKNVLTIMPEREEHFLASVRELPDNPIYALSRLLELGIAAKAPLLTIDPHERGKALVFEYGHTVGHALEFCFAGEMSHGEAVAWGMLVAAEVSREMYGMDLADVRRHYRIVGALNLLHPTQRLKLVAESPRLQQVLAADNKRGYLPCGTAEAAMVLLRRPGVPLTTGPLPLVAVPHQIAVSALARVVQTD